MNIRTLTIAAGLALACASTSKAGLLASTYDFSASATGNTQIGATNGTYTDPANPGFCVGPPVACVTGSGVSGTFAFADATLTMSTITFVFFGSTGGAGPGSFSIDLGNFVLPGGGAITNVTYGSGNLNGGDFSNVSWNGTHAIFTGSTATDFNAIGGSTVVFNVTRTVPEPCSIVLVAGGLLVGLKKRLALKR